MNSNKLGRTAAGLLVLAVLLAGCLGTDETGVAPPAIAYDSPLTDTVGIAAAHAVVSTGGPITAYSALSVLPAGLFVHGETGAISGIPLEESEARDYLILAVGEGGTDTAIVTIVVHDTAAGEPPVTTGTVVLGIGLKAMNTQEGALAKASVIQLRKLIVTLTSNVGSDDVVRDTIVAGSDAFSATATVDQQVVRSYALKPLRNWTISVKTLDVNDSVIHAGSAQALNLLLGELRAVSLNLTPRYTAYLLKANFPDSLSSGTSRQKVNFTRIEWRIGGRSVRDSSATFVAATNHVLTWDYTTGAEDSMTFRVYGTLPAAGSPWTTSSLLFARTVAVSSLSSTQVNAVDLHWMGPGTGTPALTVTVARAAYVSVEPVLPGEPLPKRARP